MRNESVKVEVDVKRWLDPEDDYSVEMLAPDSPLLPVVQSFERITLVSLVEYLRTRHGDDSALLARVLEAIEETCGTRVYREVLQELSEREPIANLLRSLAKDLLAGAKGETAGAA